MKPIIVDWQITNKCNRNCLFCYGPIENELSDSEALSLINVFKEIGVKVVGITGGEPLLRNNIIDIFKKIKSESMGICLSTNCDYILNFANEIFEIIDTLGIPIESSCKAIHDSIRGDGSFDNIKNVINYIKTKEFNIKLRVGTVLNRLNYNTLPEIEKLLEPISDNIVYWKIYELFEFDGKKVDNSIKIDFPLQSITEYLGDVIGKNKIVFDTVKNRSNSYFLIKPNADVFVPIFYNNRPQEKIVGNLLINHNQVIKNWNKYVTEDYESSIRCIYRQNCSLKTKFLTNGCTEEN